MSRASLLLVTVIPCECVTQLKTCHETAARTHLQRVQNGRIAAAAPLPPLIRARQEEAAVCNAPPSPPLKHLTLLQSYIDSAGTMVSIGLLVLGMILIESVSGVQCFTFETFLERPGKR